MDFNWFFRKGRNDPQNPGGVFDQSDNGSEENHRNFQSFGIPFIDPFENTEDASCDMFKKMDDMLNQMFSANFIPFVESFKLEDNIPKETDPRSLLLRDPDSTKYEKYPGMIPYAPTDPSSLIDNDIDDEVAKRGLLLDKTPKYNMPESFSFKKFSSIRTIHLSDGTIEEHRTTNDSQGNVTTTIRRTIGDQQHEITTHSNSHGLKETQENLTNLDENDLSEFEKRWHDLKGRKQPSQYNQQRIESLVPKITPSIGDPSYLSLFKKFFGI